MKPENITYANLPDPVTFTVIARSDPDTPITYSWYRYDEQSDCENKWCTLYHAAEKIYFIHDTYSSLAILNTNASDLGIYRCVASNSMTQDVSEVNLIAAPDSRTTSSTPTPSLFVPPSDSGVTTRDRFVLTHSAITRPHHQFVSPPDSVVITGITY